ncbi:MAG: RNA methyltransferase [Kofleriaceae bacterium]|nr:RNA methyltransferase [Kofleriaceae bacterium]
MSDAIDRVIERYGAEAVCSTLQPMLTVERITRIDTVLSARLSSLVTLVEDTYDPHNAAATIRTTEALGLQELHVVEPGDERFSAAWGITRGSHKWIDLARWKDPVAAIRSLRGRGFRVYATLPSARETIDNVDVSSPLAIAFGNEHAGLSKAAIDACDGAIGVPMFGFTESFNLSVTVGLAMSQLARRRREVLGSLGDLPEAKRRYLRARWFAYKIRAADEIIERALGQS